MSTQHTEDATRPALIPLDSLEFLNLELPQRQTIIAPWLPEQGLVMVHAERGTGKTRFAVSAGYAAASGNSWLDFEVPRARKTLYVDGEMPAAEMQALLREVSSGSPSAASANQFRILSADLSEAGIPDLSTTEGQAGIDTVVGDAELLILDNLSSLCRSGKENEAESWVSIQEWLLAKRREGRTVLFVHHTGKNGAQRGTSKREDVLDTVIALRHPDDYSPDQGTRFEVHFEKNRRFTGPDAMPFEARMETRDGQAVWLRSTAANKKTKVADFVHDGGSYRGAAKQFGVSKSTAHRWTAKATQGVSVGA